MADNARYRYYYSRRSAPPDAATRCPLSDRYFHASTDRFEDLVRPAGKEVPTWAQDLLRIAKAIHLADRRSERRLAVDKWTRHIDLTIQIEDCDPWQGSALTDLHQLLSTLTADSWRVSLRPGACPEGPQDGLFRGDPVHQVALFSGGLDSTSYAAERINTGDERLLFVSYTASKLRDSQCSILAKIMQRDCRTIPWRPISQQVSSKEPSNRTRGLLFIATAVYAAATHGAKEVIVPENGHLAINPPLTIARSAACSTRSVHPRTLMLVNRIIASVGGGNLSVRNPYLFLTKGEVCRRALNAGLTPQDLAHTVSCGSPPVLRRGNAPYHCGHCFPCLVRRSALLASAGTDDTEYKKNFWDIPSTDGTSDDVYAVRRWLNRPFTSRDLIADIVLPPNLKPADLIPMLMKSRIELGQMIEKVVPGNHPFRTGRILYR